MKRDFCILTMLFLCTTVFAQKDVPAYGKIEKADLEMKECAFDNAAEAMVLFDVGEVYCSLNLNALFGNYVRTEFATHVRIKILTDKGLNQANIKIRYRSERNLEDVTNISAQTINLDASGNIVYTKVEKSLIYRKKLNKRYSEVIFTFPEVKKGSVIEYKYTTTGDGISLRNWRFQRSIPVKQSRYTLDFPTELVVTATHKGGLVMNTKDDDKASRNIKTYSMKDIPALRNEPFISCDEDYMDQVIPIMQAFDFPGQPRKNLIDTWPEIIKALMEDEDFGLQLKRNIPRTSDLDALLAKVTDPYQKMVIIYYYVRKNMQWNDYYGIWASDGVKSAWKDKKGTSGEINLILVNLLRDADLNVHPMLVSTRDNGAVNTGLARISQFDKVMAYVEIDKHVYVLDATNKYAPVNIIPNDVVYSEGLVIEKLSTSDWGWKTLLGQDKTFQNTTILMADIDSKGVIKGEASITSGDYCRLERMPVLTKGKKEFIETYYTSKTSNLLVDSLSLENEEIDSLPLRQLVKFSTKTSSSGDYHYFSVNLFSGLENNPFIADNRTSDVFFGSNQKNTIVGHFTIPEDFQFDELPKNIKMIMPDTSIIFSRMMQATGNEVSIRITLDIKKPFYSVEEYPYFQEFYKKLFEMLNEQIVFKKK
ncbi:MAG: DUF3857 and transglutaminase domain-containing protein [Ferruginibacter sp.]